MNCQLAFPLGVTIEAEEDYLFVANCWQLMQVR